MKNCCNQPFPWFGGKGNMIKKLLPMIPKHKFYIEVFGGGAALLFAKNPFDSKIEIYNDLNNGLVDFFETLRDKDLFPKLLHLITLTPYARSTYNKYKNEWRQEQDKLKRVYKWYYVARSSFSGIHGSGWSNCSFSFHRGMSVSVSNYLSAIDKLPFFHERIMRVQIEKKDWQEIFEKYDSEDSFFYLDPPYVLHTRVHGGYENEFTNEQHIQLVARLKTIKGKYLLSGYDNEIYKDIDANKKSWKTGCFVTARTGKNKGKGNIMKNAKRTETVWYNYDFALQSNNLY